LWHRIPQLTIMHYKLLPSLLLFLFFTTNVFTQQQLDSTVTPPNKQEASPKTADIFDLSLEELMNIEISVTSQNKMSFRETPGIVTVITQQEIENSGARDLTDLLRTVPGFEIAGDGENVLGLGVRGNYALEGKALLLMDGQQINETGYGSITLGNRFLLDDIKKIEIIRGPGSAIYGGTAELAVINIITKTGEDLSGGYASATYGISEGTTSRVNGQFGIGKKTAKGLDFSFTGSYSEANRSNRTIAYKTDTFDPEYIGAPNTFNYADSSKTKNINLNVGLKYKGIALKAIIQDHKIENNSYHADWLHFGGIYLGSKYKWKINDKLTITPQLTWKKEQPWSYIGHVSERYNELYVSNNYKTLGNVTAFYKPTKKIGLTLGLEGFNNKAIKPNDSIKFTSNDKSTVSYNNIAAFAEITLENKIANFVLGARYDNHSQFGDAFVPRIAITKVINKFHSKILLSKAFKAPTLYNLEGSIDIKPEFTTIAELEVGYLLTSNMSIIGNVFYNYIDSPIIYWELGDDNGYDNYESASTVGFELDYKIKYNWGYINSSYSFYKNNDTKAAPYEIESNNNLLRGFPSHKLVVTSGINIGQKLILAPTILFNTKKVAYIYDEPYYNNNTLTPNPYTYDPSLVFNFTAHYKIVEDLKLSLSVYDISGSNFIGANPYDSGSAGTPMMGREFTAKLQYRF
jgi:outer membrane cobalamin receptor